MFYPVEGALEKPTAVRQHYILSEKEALLSVLTTELWLARLGWMTFWKKWVAMFICRALIRYHPGMGVV